MTHRVAIIGGGIFGACAALELSRSFDVTLFERRPELLLLHSDARLVDGELKPLGQTLLQALETRPGELADIAAGRAFAALMHRNLVTGATTMLLSAR